MYTKDRIKYSENSVLIQNAGNAVTTTLSWFVCFYHTIHIYEHAAGARLHRDSRLHLLR